MNNICRVCTTEIKQMCRKNTGICGEICEKAEKKSKSVTLTDVRIHEISLNHTGPGSIELVKTTI